MMERLPVAEIGRTPGRYMGLGRMAVPIILNIGFWIDHADIAGAIHEEVQQIDAVRFSHMLDAISDDDEVKSHLWAIYQIEGISKDDLIIPRPQIILLHIGLIDLHRRYAGSKAMQLRGFSNDVDIFTGARTDVAHRLRLQQADDGADVVVEGIGRIGQTRSPERNGAATPPTLWQLQLFAVRDVIASPSPASRPVPACRI